MTELLVVKHAKIEKEEHAEQVILRSEFTKVANECEELARGLRAGTENFFGVWSRHDYHERYNIGPIKPSEIESLERQREEKREELEQARLKKKKAQQEKVDIIRKKFVATKEEKEFVDRVTNTLDAAKEDAKAHHELKKLEARTYQEVEDEFNQVDLDDEDKVNSLLAELNGLKPTTSKSKARSVRLSALSELSRIYRLRLAVPIAGVLVCVGGLVTGLPELLLPGFFMIGLPTAIRR